MSKTDELFLENGDFFGLWMKPSETAGLHLYWFRVLAAIPAIVMEYDLDSGSSVAAGANLSAWDKIIDPDDTNIKLLQHDDEGTIYQFIYGITPPKARIFMQQPKGNILWGLNEEPDITDGSGVISMG